MESKKRKIASGPQNTEGFGVQFTPDADHIKACCAEFQKTWTPQMRRLRSGNMDGVEQYELRVCHPTSSD